MAPQAHVLYGKSQKRDRQGGDKGYSKTYVTTLRKLTMTVIYHFLNLPKFRGLSRSSAEKVNQIGSALSGEALARANACSSDATRGAFSARSSPPFTSRIPPTWLSSVDGMIADRANSREKGNSRMNDERRKRKATQIVGLRIYINALLNLTRFNLMRLMSYYTYMLEAKNFCLVTCVDCEGRAISYEICHN